MEAKLRLEVIWFCVGFFFSPFFKYKFLSFCAVFELGEFFFFPLVDFNISLALNAQK